MAVSSSGPRGLRPLEGIHFWFDGIHYENVTAPFIKFNSAANWVSDLRISRIGVADPLDALEHALIDNTVAADLRDVEINDCNMMFIKTPPIVGIPPLYLKSNLFQTLLFQDQYNLFSGRPIKASMDLQNEFEFCDAFGAATMAPQMVPGNAIHLHIDQNIDGYSLPAQLPEPPARWRLTARLPRPALRTERAASWAQPLTIPYPASPIIGFLPASGSRHSIRPPAQHWAVSTPHS